MHTFNVKDMTCDHCVGTVHKAIKSADPKAEVNIDLPTHRVSVTSGVPMADIARAITAAGYTPEKSA